jgi:O-antigen ligase
MIELLNRKHIQIGFIILHIIAGYIAVISPLLNGLFFVGMFLIFWIDVVYYRDKGSRAGFYALYIIGYEIVYRIPGTPISEEMTKYLSVIILLTGLFVGKRKYIPYAFIFVFVLLLPSIFLTRTDSLTFTRKVVMFNISGPLTLVASGLYFYKRQVPKKYYDLGMRLAFYPALAVLVLLSMKAGLSDIHFTTVNSKSAASGGYAPNQVSTAIGWLFLLGLLELIRGNRLLLYVIFDIGAVTFLLIRGLLTMSRGGMLSAVLALVLALGYAILIDSRLRMQLKKIFLPSIFALFILFIGMWYINKLTNNYILYRYQGKTTNEVRYGKKALNKDYTTGRGKIMEGDLLAFKANPIFGVGYGMSAHWHAVYLGEEAVAHTEFSRLLSENGIMGLIILLLCYIILPVRYFFTIILNRKGQLHFVAFIIYSYATMLHGAMRLAIPGVLYGAAFMIITEMKKQKKNDVKIS